MIEEVGEFKWSRKLKKLQNERKKRFEVMRNKKIELGIDRKCDRIDALFTPHLTNLDNANNVEIETSSLYSDDIILKDKARKSMPLAFEKITTAQALLVKENPKGVLKASNAIFEQTNLLIENVYYNNYSQQKKNRILRKYIYQKAKYGIAYWREYIKKTYKKQLDYSENGLQSKWVYDVFDVVGENIHPKNVILDDGCFGVKDINKPANDLIIHQYLTQGEFEAIYPSEKFEIAKFVKEGQNWMLTVEEDKSRQIDGKNKIQHLIYENRYDCLREIWANGYPIESVPLPGGELSLSGGKWVEDGENYDAIGVGQICEIYLPIIDDIVNCSLERLRQLVRPNEDWFNNIQTTDESDDIDFGAGNIRKFNGSPSDIIYTTPPDRNPQEAAEKEELLEEIDRATMLPRNLAGTDDAKTAYQSAQNRESALKKLAIPLDNIKDVIEDTANLDLKLYPICYSEPLETNILKEGDNEFDEARQLLTQAEENDIEDDRVVAMDDGTIARRRFRVLELPLAMTQEANGTSRVIEADEKEFWEMIPKHFNWSGRMEIIAESFLPVSKVLEDEQAKETIEFLLNVPTTDEMGKPVLTDASGTPYTIDKVKLIKDRLRINKNFNPDKYVVPLSQENIGQGEFQNTNPLETPSQLSPTEKAGIKKPETVLP